MDQKIWQPDKEFMSRFNGYNRDQTNNLKLRELKIINRNISPVGYLKFKNYDLKDSFLNDLSLPQYLPCKKICEKIENIAIKQLTKTAIMLYSKFVKIHSYNLLEIKEQRTRRKKSRERQKDILNLVKKNSGCKQ